MLKVVSNILILVSVIVSSAQAQTWKMQPVSIPTRWASEVTPENTWPEYPRPQLVRKNWDNLNGLWDYAVTDSNVQAPARYEGSILVPYPMESALSGVEKALDPKARLWYRRYFKSTSSNSTERTLLHFGAVDYEATVFLNGRLVGTHKGGYQSFAFDISGALVSGTNELVVKVYDPTNLGSNPYGKQSLHPKWWNYTASSGIWQTVWIERVPSTFIESLDLTPDVDHSALLVNVGLNGNSDGYTVEATVQSGQEIISRQTIRGRTAVHIEHPRLWSPDDPYLYDLQVSLFKDGHAVDTVMSYFGLRKIEVKADEGGRARIFLNGRYTFNLGVADQGFWPDGLYTAPTDAALRFDVQAIKALGFNTVRMHVKVESERWYMYCDRIGLLVLQDMPSSNNDSPEARTEFEKELRENIIQLHNHPSITTWVLFNEGWGAYRQDRLARWIKRFDSSRLVDGHSGPYDSVDFAEYARHLDPIHLPGPLEGDSSGLFDELQMVQFRKKWTAGDISDFHYYPGPKMPPLQTNVAPITGEDGSFGVYIEGHVWDESDRVGYGVGASNLTSTKMLEAYERLVDDIHTLEAQGLSGSNYFDMFDVEGEQQGFITYDREVVKVPVSEIARINERIVRLSSNYTAALQGFTVKDADSTSETQHYAALVAEYLKGRRDVAFLARIALMALRQNDQHVATEAGNAFIANSVRPYSKQFWRVVVAVTRTSKDRGYVLLQKSGAEADAILGVGTAEDVLRAVIYREAIQPYCQDRNRTPDWAALESRVGSEYGELGREAVNRAGMMYTLVKHDWGDFGTYFRRYFTTAIGRSSYPSENLSYQVLEHVSDPKVLDVAAAAMRWNVNQRQDSPPFGRYNPVTLDTYANLLYKLGRKGEALQWQKKAVALSGEIDTEISDHLKEMKSGVPTWGEAQVEPSVATSLSTIR